MTGNPAYEPPRNDAMGWLQHLYDCLVGDHGPVWQDAANEACLSGDNDGSWRAWRDLVHERRGSLSVVPQNTPYPTNEGVDDDRSE